MQIKSLIKLHTKVTPETSVGRVWQLLARRDITLVPVVTRENKLIGVIGEDDVLYRLVPDYREYFSEFLPEGPDESDLRAKLTKEIALTAADVMNTKVISVAPDASVYKGLSRMMAYHVRALPVATDKGKYVGMILEDDIMSYLFELHEKVIKQQKG